MSLTVFLACLVTIITAMTITGVGGTTRMCCIRGDPHLTQFGGNKANLPIPCIYKMVHTALVEMATNVTFEVVVHTASSLNTVGGRYYIDCVKVTLYVYDSSSGIPVHTILYQLYAVDMKLFTDVTTAEDAWTRSGDSDAPYSSYISKMYSHAKRKAFLIFTDGSGTNHVKVEFYPRIPARLKHRGIKVTVTMAAQPEMHNALFPKSVCSTFNDTMWGTGEKDFNSTEQIAMHGILSQGLIPAKPQCNPAHNGFSLFCFTAALNKAAVAACIKFAQRANVHCLDSVTAGGLPGNAHQAFGYCMIEFCGFTTSGALATAEANLAAC